MDIKSVTDSRKFTPEKMAKTSLFESEKMFCDVYGVQPGQEQKPHVHEDCDKIYYVVEGCGLFNVGGQVREVGEKNWFPSVKIPGTWVCPWKQYRSTSWKSRSILRWL